VIRLPFPAGRKQAQRHSLRRYDATSSVSGAVGNVTVTRVPCPGWLSIPNGGL
jgi:hypothetical protein